MVQLKRGLLHTTALCLGLAAQQIGNDLYLWVMDSVAVGAVNVAALQMGLNAFDQFGADLADTCEEAVTGSRWQMTTGVNCRGRLWVRSFGQMADEEVGKDGQDFSYRQTGAAIGGDGEVADGFRLGGSIGATIGEEEIASKGGESTSEGIVGMLYGTVRRAGAFLSAAIGGGYQTYELSRKASIMGTMMTAEAETEGVQFAGRAETGAEIGLPKDWVLTPRASVLYVHHRIEGYDESGAEVGNVAMDDHNTGSLRLKAEMDAGQSYKTDSVVYRPHVKVGMLADILPGNEVEGYFLDSGEAFTLPLSKGERFRALGGIGLEARFAGGSVAELSYEGEAGSDSAAHALMATLKFDW
jgi:outer membrane lipase/esterase